MTEKAKAVVDPSGYFDKSATTASMFDPGGAAVEKITGSKGARKIAQEALGPGRSLLAEPEIPQVDTGSIEAAQAKLDEQSLRERQRLAASESAVAKRKVRPVSSGRSLLIATGPRGTGSGRATTLSGAY